MTTETMMIASDLRNAGFRIHEHGESIRADLRSRKTEKAEIIHAMDRAGYEECQYEIRESGFGGYIVSAIGPN